MMQDKAAPRSSSVDVSSLDPTFLRRQEDGADSMRSGPSTSGGQGPNAIEKEMTAMMDLLGSKSFTILGDEEGNSKPSLLQQRDDRPRNDEEPPSDKPP